MRITVINVDLGRPVEDIINDNVLEITAENKQMIDNAIREAADKQEAITNAKNAKNKIADNMAKILSGIYESLLAASDSGSYMRSDIILASCGGEIANMISFVGKMRNWLKANQKPYKLASVKVGKESGYKLEQIATE